MISVWLEAKGRADSPRFDMLAGEAGPGFGRASHVTENRALALAFTPRPPRGCRTGSHLLPEILGQLR